MKLICLQHRVKIGLCARCVSFSTSPRRHEWRRHHVH